VLENGVTIAGSGTLAGMVGTFGSAASDTVIAMVGADKKLAFAVPFTGPGTFVKAGSGTLTLNNPITAGAFNFDDGVIVLNSTTAQTLLDTPGPVSIPATGALHGAGRVRTPLLKNNNAIRVGRAGGLAEYGGVTIDGNYISNGGELYLGIGTPGGSSALTLADTFTVTGTASGITKVTFVQYTAQLPTINQLPTTNLIVAGEGQTNDVFQVQNGVQVRGYSQLVMYDVASGRWIATPDPLPALPAVLGLHTASLFAGKTSLTSIDQRLGDIRDNRQSRGFQFWVNGLYRHDHFTHGLTNLYQGTILEINGLQVGADMTARLETDSLITLGFFFDYLGADMNDAEDRYQTETRASAFGAYLEMRGQTWFASAIFRGSKLKHELAVPYSSMFEATGKSVAASLGIGAIIESEKYGWSFEPQLQAAYQAGMTKDSTDFAGLVYDLDDTDSLEYRAGLRVWNEFNWGQICAFRPWFAAWYLHETRARSAIHLAGDTYTDRLGGAAFRGDVGFALRLARQHHHYINASMNWLYGDKYESYGFNAGFALAW
jgi:outer membrane autotransporter protein